MLLTVSKRLEFSASRRLFDRKLSAADNLARFGSESAARYGTGRNYVGYFVFSGEVDPVTGMLMNISEIKSRVGAILAEDFDHKFLNEDNVAFLESVPTPENVARQLFAQSEPLFRDSNARLVACHLRETEATSATFYADGACEANYWIDFSAARQTMSPYLTPAENEELFGQASSAHGHGHHYRARFTFAGTAVSDGGEGIRNRLARLRLELDHKHLNYDVPALQGGPMTTESLAQWMHEQISETFPVERIRLHERDDFFAEYLGRSGGCRLGMRQTFSAAHRLHVSKLTGEQNTALFGKCDNPRGHGHRYVTETTVGGSYDERSGTLRSFTQLHGAIAHALESWQDKHLDLETPEFRDHPSTGENIVQALWQKLDVNLGGSVTRLRLWETPNNRFTLRTPNVR